MAAKKTGGSNGGNGKEGGPKKRRTGAAKRKINRAQGKPVPPDETKVRTAQDAKSFWERSGAYELTQGMVLRVPAWRDVEAFDEVKAAIEAEPKKYAERLLPAVLVNGAAMVVPELAADARAHDEPGATDEEVEDAAALVVNIRESIGRLLKGRRNATRRHSFGTDVHLDTDKKETIIKGISGLLAGKKKEPRSAAARFITADDVAELDGYRKKLRARVNAEKKQKKLVKVDRSRELRQQAGLELFYDRFAAATNRIYRKQPEKRLELLSLVPRDETKRGNTTEDEQQQKGGQPGDGTNQTPPPAST